MASPRARRAIEDTTCAAPYSYKPLSPSQHTRILRLEASADRSAPLRCSLHEVDLDKDLDYDAISYTWGAPDFTEKLFVVANDGFPDSSCLKITVNLRRGLERLRRTTEARNLWIDAICIDQADKGDKARQIPRMVDIYRQASSVVVWLGDWEEQAACLARLSWAARQSTSSVDWDKTWIDCDKVYTLPWFSRRWIIQEVVLNAQVTLLCGDVEISWTRFVRVFSSFDEDFPIVKKMAELWQGHVWNHNMSQTDIISLLQAFADSGCARNLDRLYAIAGLSSDVDLVATQETSEALAVDGSRIVLPVDYSQDVARGYTDFARNWMKCHAESIDDLLVCASIRSQGTPTAGTASWLPDWSLAVVRKQLLPMSSDSIFTLSESFERSLWNRPASPSAIHWERDIELELRRGTLFGTHGKGAVRVVETLEPFPEILDFADLQCWIVSIWDELVKSALIIGQLDESSTRFMVAQFLDTLLGAVDHTHAHTPERSDVNHRTVFEIFQDVCMHSATSTTQSGLTQSPFREICDTMQRRRFIRWTYPQEHIGDSNTEVSPGNIRQTLFLNAPPGEASLTSLRVGIAPDNTEIGDDIFFTNPSRASRRAGSFNHAHGFVLRNIRTSGPGVEKEVSSYNLIGDCALVFIKGDHDLHESGVHFNSRRIRLI